MLRTRLIAGSMAGFVLSAVFATIMTAVATVELTIEPLRVLPGVPAPIALRLPTFYVAEATHRGEEAEFYAIRQTVGRGQVVPESESLLAAAVRNFEAERRPPDLFHLFGVWVLYFLIVRMLTAYLRVFSPHRGSLVRTQVGLLLLSGLLLIGAKLVLVFTVLPPYIIPVAVVPLWAALFLDRRTALMVGVALAFLTASLVNYDAKAITVFLGTGVAATVLFRDRKKPAAMIVAGLGAGLVAAALLAAALLVFDGPGALPHDAQGLLAGSISIAAGGGALAGVLALLGQRVAVIALGAVSRHRLLELTDLEQPLLKLMETKAPGSWEHSRAMANLAEGAAVAIGADGLLTRVGAYYHDLGKSCQPKYYIENLGTGETSPHDALSPHVSADAIMAHVVEGVRLLREGGIPEPVVEFAYTHHGTGVIEYFWHKCLEEGNPEGLDESFFRYPGMRPRTKETGILMIVDAVEAASRTVDPPTREGFDAAVQRIVSVKMRQGQLDESGLTFEELRLISEKITDTLCSIHHTRIKYPWQDREERGEEQLPIPGLATEDEVNRDLRARETTGTVKAPPPSSTNT